MTRNSERVLFRGFAGVWTPVMAAHRLRGAPIRIELAGEKLAVFRAREGVAAVLDRCPHRGVSLSGGRLRDGCIECPFHGWRFDGEGNVTNVPFDPDAKLESLGTVAVPAREHAGLIWIHTSERNGEAPPLSPLARHIAHWTRPMAYATPFATHWTRAMENAIDAPHLPTVHATTIGFTLRRPAASGARMDTSWTPTDYGARMDFSVEGAFAAWVDFYAPNAMALGGMGGSARVDQLMVVLPNDARRTTMLSLYGPRFSIGKWLFHQLGVRALAQDRRVVESSDPPEVPHASQEQSVRTDRGVLGFRRFYDDTLRDTVCSVTPSRRSLAVLPTTTSPT